MSLHALALPFIAVLAAMTVAFARQPDPPPDPDEAERAPTTIPPEDR